MQIRTKLFEKRKDLMDGLSAYISPVDPGWRGRLIPPEPEKLEELQRYLELQKENSKVLEAYFKFACYVSEGDGGLLNEEEFLFIMPSKVTDFINNNDEFENGLACVYDLITGMICYIDLGNDGKISKEGGLYISSSYEKYLFQRAVQKFEEKYFPEYIGFGYEQWLSFDQQKDANIALKEFIQRNQMQTVWFIDEYFLFAYNQEYSFWVTQENGYYHEEEVSIMGNFYGTDIDKIQKELLPQIGAAVLWKKNDE